jgi:phage terminase large subunit
VFKWNLKAYQDLKGTEAIIANQGGQGSSKTMSILQLLFVIAKYSKKKLKITVASYALPHLKAGAMSDFDDILIGEGIQPDHVKNRTDHIYFIGNSEIIFVGIEGNEAKVTGPRRDILYINEANKRIRYNVFELMNARSRLMTFIDFNPSSEYWFHEKVVPNFKHQLIKSNYTNNPYLPKRELDNLLSKKDKPGFENWWKVYGLGELGQLEGAIFTNWRFGEFDESLPFGYGLDFGVKHPDALVKVAVDKKYKKIYWHEELYENDLSTDGLADKLKIRVPEGKLIVADSAATRTIKDLKAKRFNIIPCIKNKIVDDIKAMKEYEIIVTPESKQVEKELNGWIWLDKKGEIPLDDFNHLIDAGRYKTMHVLKPYVNRGQRSL